MFRTQNRKPIAARTPRRRRPGFLAGVERMEGRALLATLTVTPIPISVPEGVSQTVNLATVIDDDPTVAATDLSATIAWGDGTAASAGTIVATTTPGTFTVQGSHTYSRFSFYNGYPVGIAVHDAKNDLDQVAATSAYVADAAISPGNPLAPGVPMQFSAVGTANVAATIANFKATLGGSDNGATAAPQAGGSRTITWDGVTLDGTDSVAGGKTTVIAPGSTVAIPQDRFQARGVFFDSALAVSDDGFTIVDPKATGLLPAFSPMNTVAPMNNPALSTPTIGVQFVTPVVPGSAPAAAATRGIGVVFLNVSQAGTSGIEYFAGNTPLGTIYAPVGASASPEFVGELFTNPIVTRVSIFVGTDALFSFNGTTFTSGSAVDGKNGTNLVSADDFVYGEPVPLANGPAVVPGAPGTNPTVATIGTTVGAPFSGVVATFSSANPGASPNDYYATINWGDGHISAATIQANGQGGFNVSGTNTYASAGFEPVVTTINSFGGSATAVVNTASITKGTTTLTLTSSTNPSLAGQPITLTAAVAPASVAAPGPTGTVTFLDGSTVIGTVGVGSSGVASLTTTLSPGSHSITAVYSGDSASSPSTTATAVTQTVKADVSTLVAVSLSKIKRKGKYWVQTVTLKNTSSNAISAPVSFVLDNLNSLVRLVNVSGTTQQNAPTGSPYVTVPLGGAGSFGAGQTASVTLEFTSRKAKNITYTPRVLAGVTQP